MNQLTATARVSPIIEPRDMRIGDGFTAKHFSEDAFNGLIDPVVMLDHFHMTAPTFAPHPHAGISAVTFMFEDSVGYDMNYDSCGNHGPIHPGDLHWMVAGRGVVHTEQPEGEGFHVHALQIFVNLPAHKKHIAPYAIHVDAKDIPVFRAPGVRVRVGAGESNGVQSPAVLPEPFTLLDGFLEPGASFTHRLPAGWNAMVYSVEGQLELTVGDVHSTIVTARAIGVSATEIQLTSVAGAHFTVLAGPALREPLVKHGPFVMNTAEQMQQTLSDYASGKMGTLSAVPTAPAPVTGKNR
ncbi:pirin family protein [Paraherbaspirillum soli]|uniref:Pirin family protein n=1 Tax=Paraherbaspirillum soli TaxID=631222 RepID=A0ABW0MG04_9BURK